MPARNTKSVSEVHIGDNRIRYRMETIWLQRSNPDLPWGFRMVGGQEFGFPLTIQRVTPGSVAAAALGPGDLILKVGNVMATNLAHNDAQELVRQAGNILQLTVKKPEAPVLQGQLSPSSYDTQLSVQVNEYNAAPKGFGTGIPLNNSASPNYSTTPKSYGSQHQSPNITVAVPAHQTSYSNIEDDIGESDGLHFPDYTLAYKKQDLIHDSPGGPDNIRGFVPPSENINYSSQSLPRGFSGHTNIDLDQFKEHVGPPSNDSRSQNVNQASFNPSISVDVNFATGIPIQSSPHTPQQIIVNPAPQLSHPSSSPLHSPYNSNPRPFSPLLNSESASPRPQASLISSVPIREPITLTDNYYDIPALSIDYGTIVSDQSNVHGSGSNKYSTLPHTKPAYNTNNNVNNYNVYKGAPQPYSAPKPYAPSQTAPVASFNLPTLPSASPKPFQILASTGTSSGFSSVQPVFRKVSFDYNAQETPTNNIPTNYTARPFRPLDSATISGSVNSRSTNPQDDNNEIRAFNSDAPKPRSFSLQPSKSEELYTAVPFIASSGPRSPRAVSTDRPDPLSSVNDGVNSLNMGPARYEPTPPPVWAAPIPPPPPPPGPPPPPAPPINSSYPTSNRRPNHQQTDEPEEQKIPDQLLGAMLQAASGGGPKPFTYGIDLTELKKKMGPPTAPKPKPGQPNYQGQLDEPEVPQQYGGQPKKSVGHIQTDYFIKRDDDSDPSRKASKKPAGQVQADYFLSRQTGPRSEVDESPININMGTDPKKQSKSFKVLQWMTETEQDEPEEPSQKPRRTKDPERRHNADDDEMRFTGLNSRTEIPSKAFGILQRISSNDDSIDAQNGKATLDVGDADEVKGTNGETFGRYKGSSIPSPSFRLLQTWAELDPDPSITVTKSESQIETDVGLEGAITSEDMTDKRYKGGNIPSKVFKVLQQSLGDDSSDTPLQLNIKGLESEQSVPDDATLISDF